MNTFVVVIPSRYASTRLPGKALREINGRSMLEHVHERAVESAASDVVIATDDERIAEVAEHFGARVCMTGDQHRSGTERIAEVCDLMDWADDKIVVNLQGDEPTMPAVLNWLKSLWMQYLAQNRSAMFRRAAKRTCMPCALPVLLPAGTRS